MKPSIMKSGSTFESSRSNHWPAAGLVLLLALNILHAASLEKKPADPFFEKYAPLKAPALGKLLLKPGDRLAICGDSITEQKMYSRLMETYLTVCVPELRISVRQYGWSGETAEGFLRRMTNDCLRFQPTVATTCYGMNDYRYRPYDATNGAWYYRNYSALVQAFKANGARVVVGSPGCVDKVASWVKTASGTLEEHNQSLCTLRNLALEMAAAENARFADLFWPMLTSGFEARQKYGPDFCVAGKDGVHPGWAGQLIMAYGFLRAMGLDGDIGTISLDLKRQTAKGTAGHVVLKCADSQVTIISRRYPFCATGEIGSDNSLRAGMALVPFNRELNRLMLVAKGGQAAQYRVTWGTESRLYTAEQLAQGVNLAEDFVTNPFSEAFKKVEEAVLAKQTYETRQIKQVFHSKEARADMAVTVVRTEAERAPLVAAIGAAFVPVTHELRIESQ